MQATLATYVMVKQCSLHDCHPNHVQKTGAEYSYVLASATSKSTFQTSFPRTLEKLLRGAPCGCMCSAQESILASSPLLLAILTSYQLYHVILLD